MTGGIAPFHGYMRVCIYACMHVCMHVCMCVCVYLWTHKYPCDMTHHALRLDCCLCGISHSYATHIFFVCAHNSYMCDISRRNCMRVLTHAFVQQNVWCNSTCEMTDLFMQPDLLIHKSFVWATTLVAQTFAHQNFVDMQQDWLIHTHSLVQQHLLHKRLRTITI